MLKIDEISDVVLESEYDVLNSMFDAYDKALTILEEYGGDDLTAFELFQEGFIQEASWKETKQRKIDSMNPNYVADKPKLELRQTDKKTGMKESILKSIFKAIPRLIRHVQEVHRRNMQIKKLKHISKQAAKIGADVSRMSPGEVELFYTLMNQNVSAKEMKKLLRKENWSHDFKSWLLKQGLTIGGGAIAIGGSVYYLSKDDNLIKKKLSEFKGEVVKKFDESVLSSIRDAGSVAADKISEAADKAADKIIAAANACKEAMMKAVEFIKKIYEAIKKFFNVNLLKYDKTSDDTVVCKIDAKTGALHVTLDLDVWGEWIDYSSKFLNHAAGLIAYKVDKNGNLKRNVNGDGTSAKRVGAIVNAQMEHNKSEALFNKPSDGSQITADYMSYLKKLADKTKKKHVYQPVESFSKYAEKISEKLDKMCEVANKLADVYDARLQTIEQRNDSFVNVEKEVSKYVRGILDTQTQITSAIAAVNEYIDDVAKMTESMGIVGDDKD